jgi:hypothetical protein
MKKNKNIRIIFQVFSVLIGLFGIYGAYMLLVFILQHANKLSYFLIIFVIGIAICLCPIYVAYKLVKNYSEKNIKEFCLVTSVIVFWGVGVASEKVMLLLRVMNESQIDTRSLLSVLSLFFAYLWYNLLYRKMVKSINIL